MKHTSSHLVLLATSLVLGQFPADTHAAPGAAKPSLAVTAVRPQRQTLPLRLEADGSIAAWQEASIGAETSGLRLAEVHAEAGDAVKRGQVLARFDEATPRAELAQARAALAEAEAAVRIAAADAVRARNLQPSGALSAQQIDQYLSSEASAQARVQAARANVDLAELRLRYCQVLASDDGIISQRSATLGAVASPGQELFRLIRRHRLEWRAEVIAADLGRIRPGQVVQVTSASGATTQGRVRRIAPTVDARTRTALVYVDLRAAPVDDFKPGMFARGEFALGSRAALTVPRQALVVRDGFNYVFLLGSDGHVRQTKVGVGARSGEVVEVVSGLAADATLAGNGAGFLNDGDLVKVVGGTK